MKLYVLSLGCPKNRVDSEAMTGILLAKGFSLVAEPAEADVLLVNTCSFIMDAKEESVDSIIALGKVKKKSRGKKLLVVAGCLVQQHGKELPAELPEVDLFLGGGMVQAVDRIGELAAARLAARSGEQPEAGLMVMREGGDCWLPDPETPRWLGDSPAWAYVKISDGCSRRCSFCTIPSIKGPLKNRSLSSVVEEARRLVAGGTRELVLIGQDIGAFGNLGQGGLPRLLDALETIEDLRWIRLLYLYPDKVGPELLSRLGGAGKLLRYADMPIQHVDAGVLRLMKRSTGEKAVRAAVEGLASIPGLALRSTLMVGFPGETDAAFEKLLAFVKEGHFHNLGVFVFSPEEGTPAAALEGRIPPEVGEERAEAILKAQRAVSARRNRALRGKKLEVLVEGPSPEHDWVLMGRCYCQAPDIDGVTFVELAECKPGTFVECKVIDSGDYDLVARPL